LWAWSSKVQSAIAEGKLEANEGKLKEYDTVEEIWKNMQVAED
jgi:hypothetical protein